MAEKTTISKILHVDEAILCKSFSNRHRISAILGCPKTAAALEGKIITICGWAATVRKQGSSICFVMLSDGSFSKAIQVVLESSMSCFETVSKATVGTSFKMVGTLVKSPAAKQDFELVVKDPAKHSCDIYGTCDGSKYPLSKKQHSREFLRGIAHLRPRTRLVGAITRIRSALSMATHRFFQDRGFLYIHTPIITTADCEGAGEMFQVTTLLSEYADLPMLDKSATKTENCFDLKQVDYKKDFFETPAYLTVSGQLPVESFCCSMGDVYTFGPTFRAEKSHTSRHLAEFWMIEPEIAFADIFDNMNCAEDYLKYTIAWVLTYCKDDLLFFDEHVEKDLIKRLQDIVEQPFHRITYTMAVEELKKCRSKFTVPVEWGIDFGTEHERFLTEQLYKKAVIVYDYPKDFKAFYMRLNDDGKTVRAMDVLLPKVGEVIGGSQREERLDKLDAMIKEKKLDPAPYWWYKEFRKYGSIPHSGFGLGFERLIMTVTGVENIRDVIPFPRYPGHADF